MLQVLIKKGKAFAETVPAPTVSDGCVLIKVINSCISIGTELHTINASSKSSIRKSLEDPEKIRKFINKIKNSGFSQAYAKVHQLQVKDKNSAEMGTQIGYSLSGIVISVGQNVTAFKAGDHVAAAGAGKANHAEFVEVPANLVVHKPKDIDFKDASSVAIGSIALQGARRAQLQVGEFCIVYGFGIIGYIVFQILKNTGIRTIIVDIDDNKLKIAENLGAELVINANNEDLLEKINAHTGGFGADVVIFCASVHSDEPLSNAFKMLRRKGRMVLLGVSGDRIKREDIYQKEIDFLVSTSYGPGRYDSNYEEAGNDYPYGYVRWTANRNMEEFLRLLSRKVVSFENIGKKSYLISNPDEAFDAIKQNSGLKLVFFDYSENEIDKLDFPKYQNITLNPNYTLANSKQIKLAIIGTGNFAISTHLQNIASLNEMFHLHAVMNRTGHKAEYVSKKYSAKYATTNYSDILNDSEIDLVMVCTNHALHANMAIEALKKGKQVFLEKPMATNITELNLFKEFYNSDKSNKPFLFLGFNRRFSPYIQEIKYHTDQRINPMIIHYRMNAGRPPETHWVYKEGGRIIGEACHIIDLFSYLTGSRIQTLFSENLIPNTEYYKQDDNKIITLKYEDGSVCVLEYFATGSRMLTKEYMEIHFDGKSIVLDDYKSLKGYGFKLKEKKSPVSEKGHKEELVEVYHVLKGERNSWPISLQSLIETTELTFQIAGLP